VVESLRPLTLLLGAAALWALCLLVLALGGLGEHFPPPESAGVPPPLPKVSLAPTRSRLGAWESYSEVGARPLMTEDRRPAAVTAMASEAGTAELDVILTSVMITPRVKLAVFTDNKDGRSRRVKLGDVVEGSNWRLLSLDPRQAVLEGPGGQRMLPLRVYDGSGGEAPTPVASVDPAQPGSAQPPPGPAVQPVAPIQPPRSPPAPPVAQNASPAATVNRPEPEQMSQEQQVEAIRQRIEARRAQMRAEAEAAQAAPNKQNR
jgi:general secretion pathway protein N